MNKLVSVVLPTYNGADRIKDAVQSVLGQSYSDFKLLVLDDGSTDNTMEIVAELARNDPRIKYIKNEVNLGIQKTLNRGLHEAQGEYIARIDDDDVWTDREKLSKQVEFLEKNDEYVLVGTGFTAIDERGREVFRKFNPESDQSIRKIILDKNCFLHSSVVFHRQTALMCGGYPEGDEARHIEDYELWLRLGVLGKFANLPFYGVQLTLRDGSISGGNKVEQFRKCLKIIRKYRSAYPGFLRAYTLISLRRVAYAPFQMWPFSYLYKYFYKFYKNF